MRFLASIFLLVLLALSVDAARFVIQEGCGGARQQGCCCVQGSVTVTGTDGAATLSISSMLRALCKGPGNGGNGGQNGNNPNANAPVISGTLTKQSNGVYNTTATIRNQSFRINLLAGGRIVAQNTAAQPAVCSFIATKIPSMDDPKDWADAKPCKQPTPQQVAACMANWTALPPCSKGQEKDVVNTTTCCPVCKPSFIPPRPKCALDVLDRCPANQGPIFQAITDCPACINAAPGRRCNKDIGGIPACPPAISPSRASDDCVSCRVLKQDDKCSKEKRDQCHDAIKTGLIPICAPGVDSFFNVTSCCRTCIDRDDDDDGPSDKQRCSKDDMEACMATVPVCQDGERPFANRTKCCPSCARPERKCKLADVIACRAAQRLCSPGEIPAHIDGECCATCKIPPPVCTPACNASAICVPNVAPGTPPAQIQGTAGKCLAKRIIKAKLNVLQAGGATDQDSITATIIEIILRYCDRADNSDRCNQLIAALNSIQVQSTSGASGNVDVTIDFTDQVPAGDAPQSSPFSVLSYHMNVLADSSTDAGAIIMASLNDESSADTVTASSVTEVTTGGQSGALSVAPSTVHLFAALVAIFAFIKFA